MSCSTRPATACSNDRRRHAGLAGGPRHRRHLVRPGRCGNDPRTQLTGTDRSAVADFQRYLVVSHKPDAERTDEERTFIAEYETPPPPR